MLDFTYETFGPFHVHRDGNKFRREAFAEMWDEIGKSHPNLWGAIGVYILTIRAQKNAAPKPWYVGRTDKQSFRKRFDQQVFRFGDVLDKAPNGRAHLFLLARLNASHKGFMKPRSQTLASNDDLETMMIASCLLQNPLLVNRSKVKHAKRLVVPGYMNNKQGKMTNAASELNRMVKAKSR